MKSQPLFVFLLIALVLVFGSSWNCTIEIQEDGQSSQGERPKGSDPKTGCFRPEPIYTWDQPKPEECTVIIDAFNAKENGKEHAVNLSAVLNSQRIKNHVYRVRHPKHSCWIVSVGRFTTRKSAESMKRVIQSKGYPGAYVCWPIEDGYPTCDGL